MAPHIWRVLGLKGCRVELRFHPPITVPPGADRKRLAAEAQAMVAAGVTLSNAGMTGGVLPAAAIEGGERAPAVLPLNATGSVAAAAAHRSGPTAH
jgi:hypothetical protein